VNISVIFRRGNGDCTISLGSAAAADKETVMAVILGRRLRKRL
jgi:hypothetical protein